MNYTKRLVCKGIQYGFKFTLDIPASPFSHLYAENVDLVWRKNRP